MLAAVIGGVCQRYGEHGGGVQACTVAVGSYYHFLIIQSAFCQLLTPVRHVAPIPDMWHASGTCGTLLADVWRASGRRVARQVNPNKTNYENFFFLRGFIF